MGTLTKSSPIFTFAIALVCCGPSTPRPEGPETARDMTPFSNEGRAVVVFSASLRLGPGSGPQVGEVEPGTVVSIGAVTDGWRHVGIEDPVRVKAWVLEERLGCRALRDVELTPLDDTKPQVKLRPGALVAIRGAEGDQIEVETQGVIAVKGRIAKRDCGVGSPFVPTLPRDGIPYQLVRAAHLSADVKHGGSSSIRLEEGQRFTVFITKGSLAYGRTDGPVVLRGHIDAASLDRDKRTPFDRLVEPLGYTHEAILDTTLRATPDGEPIAKLPGGTPLNVADRQDEWAHITSFGKVRLDGWLEWSQIRRVSLDHNELDPAARRREHVPIVRNEPRGMELLDEPDVNEEP